ncbi:MAG: DNA-processing protein DprA [Chloroflexi bacterium]|nr:DNA-processing protein DprA [Chloroflexota bacterium]
MTISADSQAILLLCSHLGLSSSPEFKPLTLNDWNPLARKLQSLSMRPADLLGRSAEDLENVLSIGSDEAERIARLLQRSGSLAIELERLASLGIYPITRADADYPARYRQRLKESAPSVLFYSGEKALLGQPGIAVVGSRHLDEAGQECAEFVGNACGLSGLVLYSGGAKGVDTISMKAALDARGTAVGIVAASLEQAIRDPENRAAISRRDLCLATPYSPNAPFSVGMAMGRNRLIYTLADYAIVVASDVEKGGTWAGATEALRAKWVPVFVLEHPAMPEGNKLLLNKGAIGFPHPFQEDRRKLRDWLEARAAQIKPEPRQPSLF